MLPEWQETGLTPCNLSNTILFSIAHLHLKFKVHVTLNDFLRQFSTMWCCYKNRFMTNDFCLSWNDAKRCVHVFLFELKSSQQRCLHLCPETELLLKLKKIVQCDRSWLTLEFYPTTSRSRQKLFNVISIVVSLEKIVAENCPMWHKLKKRYDGQV